MDLAIKHLITLFIIILFVDSFYLVAISKLFKKQIYDIQKSEMVINYYSTFVVYLCLTFGLYIFVSQASNQPNNRYLASFLLGIIIYGVYEYTNKAIFKDWKWSIVFVDTIWGGLLLTISLYIYDNIRPYIK